MTSIVLDASLAFALATGEASRYDLSGVAAEVAATGPLTPLHWRLEIANALTMAVRTKRISATRRAEIFGGLDNLSVVTDQAAVDVFGAVVALADKHRLTAYDAAYLELAMRTNSTLGSLDSDLRTAARKEGIAILPA